MWLAALEASAAGYLAGALIAGRARVSRGVLAVDLVLTSFAAPLVLFGLPAPQLGIFVYTKSSNRGGSESTTEWKDFSSTEPDASLFQVPAGYKVVDETGSFKTPSRRRIEGLIV